MTEYKLFSSVQITIGFCRSIILDLNDGTFHFIPNDLALVLQARRFSLADVAIELREFIPYLIEENYLHHSADDAFVDQQLLMNDNYLIQDCIIDSSKFSSAEIADLCTALIPFFIKFWEIRFFSLDSVDLVLEWCERLTKSNVQGLDLWIKTDNDKIISQLVDIKHRYSFINRFIVGNASAIELPEGFIQMDLSNISNERCGCRINDMMVINQQFYMQSLSFNNCLYKKLAIDANGLLKNCLSLITTYGHFSDVDIEAVISSSQFNKVGNISKDKIDGCKDCEFRYICSDCRAYIPNLYQKPVNCKYDPYTTEFYD